MSQFQCGWNIGVGAEIMGRAQIKAFGKAFYSRCDVGLPKSFKQGNDPFNVLK